MARKKHLINVHTSTGTTAPTGASLYLGEIAVQHTQDDPALWIKVGSAETSTEYEKFIGLTEITNIFNMSHILGSGYTYSGLPYVNSATTIADAYSALTKELIEDELVMATALNDLNDRIPEPVDLEPLSASVVTNGENIAVISAWVEDNEIVTAAALNDLNNRIVELSSSTGDNTEILEYVQENEEAVAGALNNLNERLGTVETQMTGDYIPITGYMTATGTTEEELTLTDEDTVNEAFGKLQKQMLDNEEAIAAGLNDLNTRLNNVDNIIAHNTGITQLSGAVRTLSAATEAGFEQMYQEIGDELGKKVDWDTFDTTASTLQNNINAVSAKTAGILTVNVNGTEQGKYCPSANTAINLEIIQEVTGDDVLLTGYELATGTTEEELAIVATDTVNEAFGKIQKQNYDNEAVVAGALNDLDERITLLEASGSSSDDLEELSGAVMSKEIVIAAALNDLNSRIVELSGNTGGAETDPIFSSSVAARITQQDIDNWDAAAGGGSSDPNAITGITMNGNAVSVSSRVAALGTVVTAQTQLSKGTATGTGNVVTDINVSNHQITLAKSYSAAPADQFVTLSGAAHNKITSLSGATTGINATLTAHTNNGDIHVTAAQKTAWSGKQDAITDLAAIRSNAASGMSAYNNVNALSAGTISELGKKSNTGHTHTISEVSGLQTALDGKSGTGHTHSDYATTGTVNTLNNTVTAHTANTAIHVTTAQTAAWNGKQDAINDLATIRSNAEAGAAKVSNVQSDWNATTGLAVILNKPTIPSAPGTLTTTATTAQSTATNEALTGNISLHKVSKTGSYNDLANKPAIPTVPAWATASTKPTYTASEVGALPTGTTLDGIADGTTRKLSNYATTETVNTLSNTVTAHTADTTVHVTSTEKSTWNGKANTSDIKITGLTVGGTNATVTNKVAAVPTASTNAFGVIKTGDFLTNTNGTVKVNTGTTNTTVARGDQFLAVSGATAANTSNINTLSGATEAHTATTIANGTSSQMHLPTVSASDNGKILQVKNGAWSLETPVSIYTGSGTPSQSLGGDGDIYLQTS